MSYMDGVVAPLKREREYFYDNPECHFGDHYWQENGYCRDCSAFNGGLLQWKRFEKAEREGRAHYGHFHLTVEAKQACKRGPDAEWLEAYGSAETTDGPRPCPVCGSTETVEIHDDGERSGVEQSISICAECGYDEP